ncbi:DUF5590 domain-containing protein [Salipaludibacillus agaradhaerens]|uniref:cell wall elongation regulator TseB-like domain-containing protein n=1 Tax=Salipaludibacillus agaradhaerens TaxID=76935 RepID=UPI0021515D6B|nr:DUF5590 domain-containing protein [Salipaludibacillus agaradhaerens]MCR6106615.1 DUF5590 domain-containing protein [Salipaludibacillus agaradhaerens]MCR6118648.1 DUF5590 domain-containing protein [Salipaludibacillus agaradhaerens]
MKAWIIAISVMVVIGIVAFSIYIYNVTMDPLTLREDQAVAIAREEVDLEEVIDVQYYHGRRSYQVIDGINSAGEEIYIWVEELTEEDEDKDNLDTDNSEEASDNEEENENEEERTPTIKTRLHSEGLTREEALEIAQSELDIKKVNSVKLGMAGSTPVYEISYIDTSDRHSFYYIRFEDGTYIRHYQFNP